MLEPHKKVIDGLEIQLSPLPAKRALRVFHRLGKSVSPSMARLLGLAKGGDGLDLASLNVSLLGETLSTLFADCSADDLEYFVEELLGNAIVDNQRLKDVYEVAFQAKILTLFKVLAFAVEVNYGDFFGGLRGALAQAAPKKGLTSKAA